MVLEKTPKEEAISSTENGNLFKNLLVKKQVIFGGMLIVVLLLIIPILLFVLSAVDTNNAEDEVGVEEIFSARYVGDELVVKLKESYTEDEIERLNLLFDDLGVISQRKAIESDRDYLQHYYILKFEEGVDVRHAYEVLLNSGDIESSYPNYIFTADVIPNDQFYPQMWGLEKIDMPNAWELSQGSSDITVAVIDTGVDYNHQDFAGKNIIKGGDFSTCNLFRENSNECLEPKMRDNDPIDDHGHGTHVAGTIGASTNNSIGIAGVDWNVNILAIKTMGRSSAGDIFDVIAGLQYAVDSNARVINMSLGVGANCARIPELQNLVNEATAKGIIIVAAAGNNGVDAFNYAPASCIGVITVGATDANSRRADFSNFGSVVDIAAPGVGIYSLDLNNQYKSSQGTSMAAPHVAGVISLLLAQNPGLSPAQVRSCLVNNADSISTDRNIGNRLNAFKVLNSCSGLAPITPLPTNTPIVPSINPISPVITAAPGIPPGATVPPGATSPPSQAGYTIEGVVYIDLNGNSHKDSGEPGFSGALMTLGGLRSSGILTDSLGRFSFTNLPSGSYTLSSTINNQTTQYGGVLNLGQSAPGYYIEFGLSSGYANLQPTQAPGQSQPTQAPPQINVSPMPTSTPVPLPTPVATYTCREATPEDYVSQSTLQLGFLVCERNN